MTNSVFATRAGETAKAAAEWRLRGDRAREGLACVSWGELGFFAIGPPSIATVATVGGPEVEKITRSRRQRQVASARCEAPLGHPRCKGLREAMGLWYSDDGPGLHFKPGGT
jgi:hypothetical protein